MGRVEKRREASGSEAEGDRPALRLVETEAARPTGLRRLIDAYLRDRSSLQALLTRRTSDPEAGRDLLNDIWLRIGRLTEEDAPEDPERFLRTVAGNLALDWLRHKQVRRGVVQMGEETEKVVDLQPDPERAVAARRAVEHLMALIDALPPRQKEALLLYRVEGWSMAEVGRHMGISPRTVEIHVARAVAHCDHHMTRAGFLP